MFKTGIQWLMIILIATQSVWSMADAHSGHQSGIEHQAFDHPEGDHEHDAPSSSASQDANLDDTTTFDCHHCCHCHGAHSSFISSFYAATDFFGQSPQHSFNRHFVLTQQATSLFRPPRA